MLRCLALAAAVAAVAATAAGAAATPTVRFAVALSNGTQRDAGTGVLSYGGTVTIFGAVEGVRRGVRLVIVTHRHGWAPLARELRPGPDGGFRHTDVPVIGTRYEVRVYLRDALVFEGAYTALIRPRLDLRAVWPARGLFAVSTRAARVFPGRLVWIERRDAFGEWHLIKTVRLGASSAARFRLALPRGRSALRAILPAAQARPGYTYGLSNLFYFRRS